MNDELHQSRNEQAQALIFEHLRQRRSANPVSDEALIDAHPNLREELVEGLKKARALSLAFAQADASESPRRESKGSVNCPACDAQLTDTEFMSGDTVDSVCHNCGRHVIIRQEPDVDRVGHFELIDRLGSGGFGTVWRALDTKLDREVAIKIATRVRDKDAADTKTHGDGTADDAFVREARAAAQLKHPNIVATYEVGHDGPTTFIACELIDGMTLKERLERGTYQPAEAAALCRTIADAVHYAHEEGVIHRDLKPQNVLLDYDGRPHIADFGLARRESNEITVTMDGQIVGTPAYMSPEQAQGDAHASDRRSDVYAIGVMLFELLTGELPFRGSLPALMHQVVSVDPPRPRSLQPRVPRDLETICLKCLQKRPEQRYASAGQLAADLARYLAKEPIHARPIGPWGRSIRWCQRRPALAAAIALLITVTVAGFVGVTWQAMRAISARKQTEIEAARTQRVLDFLVSSFRSPDPENSGRDVRVVDVLERAIDDAQEELQADPVQVASLLDAIGETLRSLGAHQPAIRAHQQALEINRAELGERHPDTLWSMNYLGVNFRQNGDLEQAIPILERTLELRRSVLGVHAEDTLQSMANLAIAYSHAGQLEKGRVLSEQCLEQAKRHFGEEHELTLVTMNNLGGLYGDLGLHDQATKLLKQNFEIRRRTDGEEHPSTLLAMNNLANSYLKVNQTQTAIPLLEKLIPSMQQTFGSSHNTTLSTMNNLATAYMDIGQLDKAIPMFDECLARALDQFGEQHEATLQLMINSSLALRLNDQLGEALARSEQALALCIEHRGEQHPSTLLAMRHVAAILELDDQLDRSIEMRKSAYELTLELMGQDHEDTLGAQREWIASDLSLFERGEALELLEDNIRRERQRLINDAGTLATILSNVAETMIEGRQFREAASLLEESSTVIEELAPDHWKLFQAKSRMGAALAGCGENAEAERLLLDGYQGMKDRAEHQRARPAPEDLEAASQRLIDFYLQTGRPDEAAQWQQPSQS